MEAQPGVAGRVLAIARQPSRPQCTTAGLGRAIARHAPAASRRSGRAATRTRAARSAAARDSAARPRAADRTGGRSARHQELDEFGMGPGERHRRPAWPAREQNRRRDRLGVPHLLGDHPARAGHRRHRLEDRAAGRCRRTARNGRARRSTAASRGRCRCRRRRGRPRARRSRRRGSGATPGPFGCRLRSSASASAQRRRGSADRRRRATQSARAAGIRCRSAASPRSPPSSARLRIGTIALLAPASVTMPGGATRR